MFKRSLLAGLSLALIFSLVVFSMPSSSRAADATATLTPAPTATPVVSDLGSGGTHIAFWNGLTGSDGDTLNAMLATFVKENPSISITTEEIDWGTLYPKLTAAFVGGEPPDMFIVHVAEIPYYLKQGVIQPNDDLFDTNGGPLPAKDFAEPAYSNTVVDGKHYGVLLDNHGYGTWVNNDLLTKAGLDPKVQPKSGAETLAMLQKLTIDKNGKNAADPAFDATNVVQWGTAIDWPHYMFQSLLFQFGGTVISADGKKATINSKAGVDALQTIYDWVYKYHVAPPPAGFDSWVSFQTGKVAILTTGTWFRNRIASVPTIHWTAWPMLQVGPQPGVMFGAHIMLIPANTTGDKLTAVKKLMVWVSNHNADWAASGQVPARISIRDGLDPKSYPSNIAIGQSYQVGGHMEAPSPSSLDIGNAEDPELSAVLANQKTPQQGLDDAAKRIQAILDRQ